MTLAVMAAFALTVPNTALAAPSAKEKADAKALLADARKAVKERRVDEAMRALEQASKLDPGAEMDMEIARVEMAAGKLIAASKRLTPLATTDDGTPAGKKVREGAKKELGELMMKIPAVKIAVKGPPAEVKVAVKIDGNEASVGSDESVDPGEHTITASAEGWAPAEQKVTLAEGARQSVELVLEGAKASAPKEESWIAPRLPGIVVGGVGGVTLIVGAVVGGAAMAATSSAKSGPGCVNNVCPDTPEVNDRIAKAKTLGNASTGLFIGGGVALAAGTVLFFVLPELKKNPGPRVGRVVPWIGADQVGIAGSF